MAAIPNFYFSVFAVIVPISEEEVGVPCPSVVPVGCENEFFAIWAEHGEGVKDRIISDLFEIGSVHIDPEKVKNTTALGMVVGAEYDLLAARVEIGRPVRTAEIGDLFHFAPVYVANEDLHIGGLNQPLCQ